MKTCIRKFRSVPVVLALALITGVPYGSADPSHTVPSLTSVQDCTFNPASYPSNRERWREVSRQAEIVAHAASTGRRRAIRPVPPLPPMNNFIDEHIFKAMADDGIRATRLTTDEEFIRRATIALTGDIPRPGRVLEFIEDDRADKRDRLIEELVNSEAFVDRWAMWLGDHVQNVRFASNFAIGTEGMLAYYAWIREAIASRQPFDRLVFDLITGSGDTTTAGEANYVVRQLQPNGPIQDTYDNLAAHTSQRFLGLPLECLSCHSGPFHLELINSYLSTRTREEFWGSAAFFARTGVQFVREGDSIKYYVNNVTTGQYFLNTEDGNKTPRILADQRRVEPDFFLGGGEPYPGEHWRFAYARLLTENRQFARAMVNYLWKELFHLGIVEPADSFDLARLDPNTLAEGAELQPTHPALLEALTDEFIDSGFDLRGILSLMVQSRTWQLATEYTPGEWDESWTPYFARHYPRRLSSEALYDAIGSATLIRTPFRVEAGVSIDRAMKLPDPTLPGPRSDAGFFLDAFGRGDRDDEPRTYGGSVVQALNLMNSRFVTERVSRDTRGSAIQLVLDETQDPLEIVAFIYLSTLSRFPTEEEVTIVFEELVSSDTPVRVIEDLQYGLINSLEFLFN